MARTAKQQHHRLEAKRARRRHRTSTRSPAEERSRRLKRGQLAAEGVQRFESFFEAVRESNKRSAKLTASTREAVMDRRMAAGKYHVKPQSKHVRVARHAEGVGRRRLRKALRRALPVKVG